MVTANARKSYRGVASALRDRELKTIGALTLLTGAGILVAQRVSDFVLPQLNMPRDPSTPTGHAASALTKVLGAAVIVTVGGAMGTGPLLLGGGVAAGMLGLAGADLITAVENGSLMGAPGAALTGGRAGARQPRRVQRAPESSGTPDAGPSSTKHQSPSRNDRVSAWG